MELLTKESFKARIFDWEQSQEWTYKGTKPAIIDFYADWCGPCKMLAPIFEDLSKTYPGIDFYKVDTEAEQELAMLFNIMSIPSILFIPVNEKPQMVQGALPKETFTQIISDVFKL